MRSSWPLSVEDHGAGADEDQRERRDELGDGRLAGVLQGASSSAGRHEPPITERVAGLRPVPGGA